MLAMHAYAAHDPDRLSESITVNTVTLRCRRRFASGRKVLDPRRHPPPDEMRRWAPPDVRNPRNPGRVAAFRGCPLHPDFRRLPSDFALGADDP
jgi:hypothetical protein